MIKIYCVLFMLMFFSKSFSQVNTAECWETTTKYNSGGYEDHTYRVLLSKDSIQVSVDNKYTNSYKLNKKDKSFFLTEGDKFIVKKNKNKDVLQIKYYYPKLRISVNEIITLHFRRCID